MKFAICAVFVVLIAAGTVAADPADVVLQVGDATPAFSALDDNGEKWNSGDYVGEKVLVVYFYPAAMTGGCTAQACAYRDDKSALDEINAMVVGISGDRVENLKVFKQVHNLNFTLLSDQSGEIARQFGVPVRQGGTITRTVDGAQVELARGVTTSRWTFVIDKKGKIIYKNTEVNAAEDSKAILSLLRPSAGQ